MKIQNVKYKDIEQIPKLKLRKNFKQKFQGSSPTPFIGRFGYPHVNIGFLSPQISGDTSSYDSPKLWKKSGYNIGQIASMRYDLVNSRTKWQVKSIHNGGKMLDIVQEVGMAKKPVELDVALSKPPALNYKSEAEVKPWGPAAGVLNARVTENVSTDTRVEKVVSDTDLKSSSALMYLHKKGFEEGALSKLISVGNLGVKKNRKLVPTRWSITAVDDTIGKNLLKQIKDLPQGEYAAYFGGGWGNYYLILFFPEVWSYELFETYLSLKVNPWSKEGYAYSTDYEPYGGRKSYAEETAGGYYACRLPILEKMQELKRQGSCLALRFITPEYNVPLGVWVCREAAKSSLNEKPLIFGSEELLLKYARLFIQKKFGFNLDLLLNKSKLLLEKKKQKKLTEF